ncbi:bifunctional diguanylate cyclase/phosphodiesterase [Geovibrio ferrireducens]|uniref:bifunctional diguanylate cyclase/phosphodiesterase n=1 Tax=Geovibrio ferrireducens TaxID=46201 RepID=UPI002246C2D4|nr:EAL domain-containing protein [Geovibrio ferrireducens]
MTLFRQLQIFVTVMLLAVLGIVLQINFSDTKEYVRNQLYTNAKNTANSLSLSMSPFMDDLSIMETMINAMFDGGYYEEITLIKQDGTVAYSKSENIAVEGVPQAFINMVRLEAPVAEAAVSGGWSIYGTLKVKVHLGHSYLRLWETFKQLCLWFVVLGGLASLVSYFILKLILASLNAIKAQAEAVGNNEFIINERVPKTPELRQVVLAINAMVQKVQGIYNREVETLQKYQELQYKDAQTGLYNRKYFIKQFSNFVSSNDERSKGEVILFSFEGLEKVHQMSGFQVVQQLYDFASATMKECTVNKLYSFVSCLNSNDFVITLPSSDVEESTLCTKIIYSKIKDFVDANKEFSGHTDFAAGIVSYNETDSISSVLTKADYALSAAKNAAEPHLDHFRDDGTKLILGKLEWKKMIESALSEQRFMLTSQPVVSEIGELHREIFINMIDLQGQIQRAGYFMPMVIKLSLANDVDQYVLRHATDFLDKNQGITLAVNVSNDFLKDRESFTWFRKFLSSVRHLNSRLVFEIPDEAIGKSFDICLDFSGLLKGTGFKFGIDRFVMNETSVKYLHLLKPDYIKVEQDYLLDIENNGDAGIALNAFLTITESLGIKLIATKIENEEQKAVLEARQIKYFQGRGIADISPLGDKK